MKSIFLFISLWVSAGLAGAMPARWRTGYVPFSVPWVDSLARDSRVVAVADISFPSMVPVKFNPTSRDPGAGQETMWVRILDRDPETGVFLGDLMGRPERLLSVSQHDNVIFKFGAMMETLPSALLVGDSYLALGGKATGFAMAFVDGVAANRAVIYGGLRDSIAACRDRFRKALALVDSSTPLRERFHANYLLGRCHSEGFELDSAIKYYKTAMRIDSSDMDAPMSLMGDFTIEYAQALMDRNISAAMVLKSKMQKLSDLIRVHDGRDRRFGAMLDHVYSCEDSARQKRRDPCKSLRYRR